MAGMVPVGLDVATSNITRICDYLLGGKDNFAVGREPAGKLIAMMPRLPPIARDNRAFGRRVVQVGRRLPTVVVAHNGTIGVGADGRVCPGESRSTASCAPGRCAAGRCNRSPVSRVPC